jgi:hypothetical protein
MGYLESFTDGRIICKNIASTLIKDRIRLKEHQALKVTSQEWAFWKTEGARSYPNLTICDDYDLIITY